METGNFMESMTIKYPYLFRGTIWRDSFKRIKIIIQEDDYILDVGSLKAPYARYLNNLTIAIDLPEEGRFGFSKETINELKSFNNIETVFADVESLPFEGNSFDVIICTEVIEHIHNPSKAVSEMARVLKSTGRVFITTPNGEEVPLDNGIVEHVHHFSEELILILYFSSTSFLNEW